MGPGYTRLAVTKRATSANLEIVTSDLSAPYRLGIVGAGQIARMTHQAAVKLGITPRLLAENIEDSAAQTAPDAIFSHPDSLAAFAEYCAVITFEHERVDVGLIEAIETAGATVRPGTRTLRAAFDKLHQRRVLGNRNFPVPAFSELRGPDDLFDFSSANGFPIVIKSVRAPLPGQRSVWIVETGAEALRVVDENGDRQLMAESFQPIVKELVTLVVRRPGGHTRTYPVTEVINNDGACVEVRSPAAISAEVAEKATTLARDVADELDAVGVLAVEMFLTPAGLVINEIAARPHNAGHHTIESSPTSQFENHVRAVLDLPLGPTWMNAPAAVTVNVVGGLELVDPSQNLPEALAVEGAHVHLYGKRPGPGVKLGHVTAVGDDLDQARFLARRAEAALLGRRI